MGTQDSSDDCSIYNHVILTRIRSCGTLDLSLFGRGNWMKKVLCIFSIIAFALTLASCTNAKTRGNDSIKWQSDTEKLVFTDVEVTREELQSSIWGSHGWRIYPSENYIYAGHGKFLLRYNIANNEIDKALRLDNNISDIILHFSSTGKHAIGFSLSYPKNIYLLDFEEQNTSFLADSENDFAIEMLPLEIRAEFNKGNFFFEANNYNLSVLEYNINYNAEQDRYLAYSRDGLSYLHEITALKGASLNSEYPFVGIDGKTIGSLVPASEDEGMYLGYYKFVLIDIEKDEIIQECPINSRH